MKVDIVITNSCMRRDLFLKNTRSSLFRERERESVCFRFQEQVNKFLSVYLSTRKILLFESFISLYFFDLPRRVTYYCISGITIPPLPLVDVDHGKFIL